MSVWKLSVGGCCDLSVGDLTGKEVVGLNGYKIGKAKDLVIDRNSWRVTHIDVELKSEIEQDLGMASSPLAHNHLPIDVSKIEGVGEMIILKTTREQLVDEITAYSKVPEMEP
jgi:sporulation protein YlmC with PRC-barrel domain